MTELDPAGPETQAGHHRTPATVLANRNFRAADHIYRRLEADARRSDEARRTSPNYNPHRLKGQAWRDWQDGKLT